MRSPSPRLLAAALVVAAPALGGATCSGRNEGADLDLHRLGLAPLPEKPHGRFLEAIGAMKCPCGEDHDLARCAMRHAECPSGATRTQMAWRLAAMGATPAETRQELTRYAAAMQLAPASIRVDAGACRGSEKAPVTLVEFSDFECPACSMLAPVLDALVQESGGKTRLCFRHFPLARHERALGAAMAAEFARTQGKFWELHDRLFENQGALAPADLRRYASEVGLELPALEQALCAAPTCLEAVNASKAEGTELGVEGTPTLFINGRPFSLPLDGTLIGLAVSEEAARAGAMQHD